MEEDFEDSEDTLISDADTLKQFNNNFVNEYREFTEEDYYRLQQNLIAFKNGDQEAITYIVSTFHQFISKYARFVCFGKLSEKVNSDGKRAGNDKSLNQFVRLFMTSDKTDKKLKAKDRHKHFCETCTKISLLFSKYEYWDIYNELVCALLNMAKKYKITQEGDLYHKKNGTFHMYVYKCFHFEAYNTLKKLIDDPLAHLETYSIYEHGENCGGANDNSQWRSLKREEVGSNICAVNHKLKAYSIIDTSVEKDFESFIEKVDRKNAIDSSTRLVLNEQNEISPYDIESLNFNWTNGTTCSELFDVLTSYERELLVHSFIQNKTDSEIARLYGCHRITIVKHKKIAVNKIKEVAAKSLLIKKEEIL